MFNNRWVCETNEKINLGEIVIKLEENNFFVNYTNENELKNKIEILGRHESDNLNFIFGRYGFEYESTAIEPEIREDKIIDTGDVVVVAHVLNFWIADNKKILFSSKNKNDKKGKAKLSEILFNGSDKINEVKFDINAMNKAVSEGALGEMWISSFSGRNDNIRGGTFHGNRVNEDSMYAQTDGVPKSMIGIYKEIKNKEMKIKVFESGIQILTKDYPKEDPILFKVIDDLKEYIKS